MNWWKLRIKSFGYAWRGMRYVVAHETHAQLHLLSTLVVTVVGLYVQLSTLEWCAVIGCCGVVIAFELVNTAIEKWIDHVHPQQHPTAGLVKDIMAGAVLVVSIAAFCIGLLIFFPKINAL